jgi:hypothetical protein
MSEIKFACPHCSQHVACDDAYCGERINCPGCGLEMRIPAKAVFVPMRVGGLKLETPMASKVQPPLPNAATADLLTDEQWGAFAAGKSMTASFDTYVRVNWLFFFGVLLAPAVAVMIGMMTGSGGLVVFATFIGSGWAGITCGTMLARRLARGGGINALLVVMFSVVFAVLSFILCFVGCVIPAVLQMNNH